MVAFVRQCGLLLGVALCALVVTSVEAQRPTTIAGYRPADRIKLRAVRGICRHYTGVVSPSFESELAPFRQLAVDFYQRNLARVNTIIDTVSNLPDTGGQILSNLETSVTGCIQQQPQLNAIYTYFQQNGDLDAIAQEYGDRAQQGFDPQAIADGAVDCALAAADRFIPGGSLQGAGNIFLNCVTNSPQIGQVRNQATQLVNSTNALEAQAQNIISGQTFNSTSQGFQQCANQTVQQGTGQVGQWQGQTQGAGMNFASCLLGGITQIQTITGTVRGILEGQGKTVTPGSLLTEIGQCMNEAATTVINRADPRARLTALVDSIEQQYTGMFNEVVGYVDSYQALYNEMNTSGSSTFSLRGQIENACQRYQNLGLPR